MVAFVWCYTTLEVIVASCLLRITGGFDPASSRVDGTVLCPKCAVSYQGSGHRPSRHPRLGSAVAGAAAVAEATTTAGADSGPSSEKATRAAARVVVSAAEATTAQDN